MTTTLTADVNATLQQIAELTAVGLPDRAGRRAVARTTSRRCRRSPASRRSRSSPTSTSSRSTSSPRSTRAARRSGSTPATSSKFDDKVERDRQGGRRTPGIPIRIGVNAGSLDQRLLEKYGKATAEALVESALWECSLFEEHGFRDIKISVKHNDPVVMIRAYRQLAEQCDYPLHLGVTEAGPAFQGTIKSSVAFGALLAEGIGDTIRVSLSAPPVEEVKVGNADPGVARPARARPGDRLVPVLRPGPGRRLHAGRAGHRRRSTGFPAPLRVAVMGCVVNGPGEAREADLGVASGNGKGQIFVKGEVIKTVPESQIVETLVEEALRLAERDGRRPAGGAARPAGPSVTVH